MFGRNQMTMEKLEGSRMNLLVDCSVCGTTQTLLVKDEDFDQWAYEGEHTQNAFPYLTPPEREVLISGTCGNCFLQLFGDHHEPVESEGETGTDGRVIINTNKIIEELVIEENGTNKFQFFLEQGEELQSLGYTVVDEVKEPKSHKILYGKNGWYMVLTYLKK